MHLFDQKHREN